VLARLWQSDKESLATVVRVPNTSQETICWLHGMISSNYWDKGDKQLAIAIASNPNTSQSIISNAWENWRVPNCWSAIAYNPSTSNKYLNAYKTRIKAASVHVQSDAAKDPLLPLDLMEYLANSDSRLVGKSLAYNKSCPTEIVAILAQHSNERVRNAVAGHPNITPALKAQIKQTNIDAKRQEHLDSNLLDAARAGNQTNIIDALQLGANPNYSEPIPVKIVTLTANDLRQKKSCYDILLIESPSTIN